LGAIVKLVPRRLWTDLWLVNVLANWIGVALFLVWFHRAATSTRTLGRTGLSISPGWCVGWFFVPLANFYMPYKAMSELAAALDPRDTGKAPGIVLVWWVLFVGRIVPRALPVLMDAATPDRRTDLLLNVVDTAISSGAAVALFLVMRFIHDGQAHWALHTAAHRPADSREPGA
jgi:hypothetical protein